MTLLKLQVLEMDFSGTPSALAEGLVPEALAQFATAGTSSLCDAEGRRTTDVHIVHLCLAIQLEKEKVVPVRGTTARLRRWSVMLRVKLLS